MQGSGKQYSRLFRKAGVFLRKGQVAEAIGVFEEGEKLAKELGDEEIVALFAQEIKNSRRQQQGH